MSVGSLPDGTRGFDVNLRLGPANAAAFFAHGYRFVVRYVRRVVDSGHDLNAAELETILQARLALMVVQHVARPGWQPTGALGATYGATAAAEARQAGVPPDVQLWCDLEGVAASAAASDVIDFCNQWHDAVAHSGFRPGLYVGYAAGLTATELYEKLRFNSYWSGYNLNADEYPAVRGVQMRQFAASATDLVPGFAAGSFDVDVIHADALGGSPSLLLPWQG